MNNKKFLEELSNRCGISVKEAQDLSQGLLDIMQRQWQDGDVVNITGFGAFGVRKKNERISVNPSTGVRMLIPPKLAVTFKPSSVLKDKLNGKGGDEV